MGTSTPVLPKGRVGIVGAAADNLAQLLRGAIIEPTPAAPEIFKKSRRDKRGVSVIFSLFI
jgi:hypothetical protein